MSDSESQRTYDLTLADPETKEPLCIIQLDTSKKPSAIIEDRSLRSNRSCTTRLFTRKIVLNQKNVIA